MHAVVINALRTAQRPISWRACRIIAGSRYPLSHRKFHRSAISYQAPEDPGTAEDGKQNSINENPQPGSEQSKAADKENAGPANPTPPVETLALTPRLKNGKSASGRVRGQRLKQPEGVPPVVLPEWFWDKNVKCIGDNQLSGTLAVYGEWHGASQENMEAGLARQNADASNLELEPTTTARYSIHVDVYKEIISTLRAGLALRPPKTSASQSLARPVTVLQCPKDGGTFYLDSVVESIATKLDADLVRLDSQDIAQIVGHYIHENLAWNYSTTALLAYDAHKVAGKLEEYDKEYGQEDGLEPEENTEEAEEDAKKPSLKDLFKLEPIPPRSRNRGRPLDSASAFAFAFDPKITFQQISAGRGRFDAGKNNNNKISNSESPLGGDQWNDLKVNTALDALISSSDSKRAKSSTSEASEDPEAKAKSVIIQVKDYKEMMATSEGANLLTRLRFVIDKKWQEGKNIICVGTTSYEQAEPALSKPEIQELQSDIIDGEKRTIFVPPSRKEAQDEIFEKDEKSRIRRINVRHVEDMVHKLAEGTHHALPVLDIEKDLDSTIAYAAGLEDAVWTYARVHRIAVTVLGLESSSHEIDGKIFSEALELLSASDEAKFAWGAEELRQEDEEVDGMLKLSVDTEEKRAKDRLKEIRKKCNNHEKKFLSGVVFPADIRTTFNDIRAPKETVEALKTLTSLSLIRPEAFSYGVLATDKIPGVLLYGPPGTGKTLLAKAVAKESGATVLEVTAADLNDMYVGQGEKNVKALFSLAKKLSPCVVFIDEADAIFAARHEHNRNAHREMINQFLREWDGMNDFSAFMMVATNRPFDLDDAVLRRLPRRLLVDLPVEKDREAILKIHLRDEILDESISLAKIAKDTPFYSGSDLKNLSVAAALACIREENDIAAKHVGDEPHVYPEKRILTKKHFDKAMEEISASISEDMSSLSAIRKFDEKYGDRKGRRKKGPGLGFGGTRAEEKDSEAAMVRKMGA